MIPAVDRLLSAVRWLDRHTPALDVRGPSGPLARLAYRIAP